MKYVGQTQDLEHRLHQHWPSAHKGVMRDGRNSRQPRICCPTTSTHCVRMP
jgi:hypothetical protein